MTEQDPLGRLKGELRVTRERQARLRYQIRHQVRSLTRLREEIGAALTELEDGRISDAQERLYEALASSTDPDHDHLPPGARRKATKRIMEAREKSKDV